MRIIFVGEFMELRAYAITHSLRPADIIPIHSEEHLAARLVGFDGPAPVVFGRSFSSMGVEFQRAALEMLCARRILPMEPR